MKDKPPILSEVFGFLDAFSKDLSAFQKSAESSSKIEDLKHMPTSFNVLRKFKDEFADRVNGGDTGLSGLSTMRISLIEEAVNLQITNFANSENVAYEKATADIEGEGKYVVAGHIADIRNGEGLPNILVEAFDADPDKKDDPLGSAKTDEYGYYRIEYERKDFDKGKTGQEKEPETYIVIRDESGKEIVNTRDPVEKAGKKKIIDITVDGNLFPNSQSLLRKFKELREQKLKQLDQRQQILKSRFDLSDKGPT